MRVINGNSRNVDILKGLRIVIFIVNETVYRSGKVEIVSWTAGVEDEHI